MANKKIDDADVLDAQLEAVRKFVDSIVNADVTAYRINVYVTALQRRGANGYNLDPNGISECSDVSLRIQRDYGAIPPVAESSNV